MLLFILYFGITLWVLAILITVIKIVPWTRVRAYCSVHSRKNRLALRNPKGTYRLGTHTYALCNADIDEAEAVVHEYLDEFLPIRMGTLIYGCRIPRTCIVSFSYHVHEQVVHVHANVYSPNRHCDESFLLTVLARR